MEHGASKLGIWGNTKDGSHAQKRETNQLLSFWGISNVETYKRPFCRFLRGTQGGNKRRNKQEVSQSLGNGNSGDFY